MVATALWARGYQLVRHPRHSDPGSDRGSPWTSRKSAEATLGEDAGAGLAQQPPAVDGGRGQGVIGLQPGGDQRLTLPGELVGPQPAAAEVGPGAKQHPAACASRTDS